MKNTEKQKMNEAPAQERINNFSEVALGYNEEQARIEAQRCIQCKKPSCVAGCPVEINIPKFIKEIASGEYSKSISTLKEKSNLPAVCGRVCPQETQCELKCILSKKGNPVAIGYLERFAADYEMKNKKDSLPVISVKKTQGHKVAIIGSGPAGLTCAGDLARAGASVTIFEALHKSGGVLSYGIPPFRLPRNILNDELNYIKSLGVEIQNNIIIGKTFSIEDLFAAGYKAVFIGAGAGLPVFPGLPGENLCGIYSANEFLTRINLMSADKFPESDTPLNIGSKTVVIGGGNTAMDSARCAIRIIKTRFPDIKPEVTIIYRRTESEMPARKEEIEHAKQEGINFEFLTQPVEFINNGDGFLSAVKCLKCELGAPDSSGRRKPVPLKNSEFIIETNTAVLALGLKPNPLVPQSLKGLKTDDEGNVIVNPETAQTSIDNVYAGGDIIGGEGTVIEAMGMGKKAAKSIINVYLNTH
ncbi:MAG: glutamate synthase (NADPH), homotetrameric [Elusimicrobia bacterium RIFOXYA2_FULL_39_19]|nr:MAG: glutamate synthase (NADPH), homotetrameric [Elusimicrobia bacterium RIFOXYA2_FULL_39_19]